MTTLIFMSSSELGSGSIALVIAQLKEEPVSVETMAATRAPQSQL